jgi:hypothetical protein
MGDMDMGDMDADGMGHDMDAGEMDAESMAPGDEMEMEDDEAAE